MNPCFQESPAIHSLSVSSDFVCPALCLRPKWRWGSCPPSPRQSRSPSPRVRRVQGRGPRPGVEDLVHKRRSLGEGSRWRAVGPPGNRTHLRLVLREEEAGPQRAGLFASAPSRPACRKGMLLTWLGGPGAGWPHVRRRPKWRLLSAVHLGQSSAVAEAHDTQVGRQRWRENAPPQRVACLRPRRARASQRAAVVRRKTTET